MDFEEFKWRIENCKKDLEGSSENDVYKKLRDLRTLIKSANKEKFFNPDWEHRIMLEIDDMDKAEYEIRTDMTQRKIKDRLDVMRYRIRVELNSIIHSPEKK